MADIADLGNDRAEQQLDDILAARQRPAAIVGSAKCLHCDEAIEQDTALRFPKRWCDSDCRDEWEKRHPQRKAALPREALPFFSPLRGRIRPNVIGEQPGGSAAAGSNTHSLVESSRQAERDEAKYMLRGHR